jgi:hypothetical protein
MSFDVALKGSPFTFTVQSRALGGVTIVCLNILYLTHAKKKLFRQQTFLTFPRKWLLLVYFEINICLSPPITQALEKPEAG